MTKKKDDLTGKVIKLTKVEKDFLKTFIDARQALEFILEHTAERIQAARKKLWDVILDFYPELKDYYSKYNSVKGEITVVGKETKKEK